MFKVAVLHHEWAAHTILRRRTYTFSCVALNDGGSAKLRSDAKFSGSVPALTYPTEIFCVWAQTQQQRQRRRPRQQHNRVPTLQLHVMRTWLINHQTSVPFQQQKAEYCNTVTGDEGVAEDTRQLLLLNHVYHLEGSRTSWRCNCFFLDFDGEESSSRVRRRNFGGVLRYCREEYCTVEEGHWLSDESLNWTETLQYCTVKQSGGT